MSFLQISPLEASSSRREHSRRLFTAFGDELERHFGDRSILKVHDNLTNPDKDNPENAAIEEDLSKFTKTMAAYQLLGGEVPVHCHLFV